MPNSFYKYFCSKFAKQGSGQSVPPVAANISPFEAKNSTFPASIYQIFYSKETFELLEPGYIPLDNTSNVRSDWREYYPIRNFLLNNALDDNKYYGFFSPKFFEKTSISAAEVLSFVGQSNDADAVIFSPLIDLQALFVNCFVQGDAFHPGLLNSAQKFFNLAGYKTDLRRLVMDSRNSVFCNYFVAKPSFWRAWLELNEKLFSFSEGDSALTEELNAVTTYGSGNEVQMKVFIMERVVSFLLATDSRWITSAYNPFHISTSSISPFCNNLQNVIMCDALKIAYRETGYDSYINRYFEIIKENSIPQSSIG